MKRFQVLDRDTQVFGWFFLEASAGTGKTFAIEHIVVRTILESNPPIPIEKILIVTFTRAATRELKVRIRNNLTKTLLFLQQENSGPDYLQPIFEKDSSEIFSAKRKIEEALCNFDKANVFTLHGFCHKILSEFAFEAGEFFELDSPESRSHSLKILQVVEDYFRAGIDTKRFSPAQIDLLITSKPSEACRVIKKIAQSIEKDVHIEDFLCWSELIECFNSHLIDVSAKFDFIKERYDSDMALLFPLFKKIKAFHKNEADSLFNILNKQQITEKEFANVIQSKEYFLSLLCDDNLKKGKDPYKLKLFYPELRNLCIERFLPLIEQASDKEKIFLRLTSECLKSWKSFSLYQGSFSPDDLLRKMAGALKKDFLKEKISEKFIIGIIDEFQDTDPIQWEIFRLLFLSKDQLIKTIYLVGDPKQSIYSFRNADVYTYIQAMNDIGQENRLFLDTNFRSEPSLVHALNTLFTQDISKEWMTLPSSGECLEVIPVKSRSEIVPASCDNTNPDLNFFICEGKIGRSKKWPNEDLEQASIFPYILAEIQRMTNEEGIKYGQIAILVRDRYQASRIEEYFKNFQVPLSVKRSLSLEKSQAYAALHDVIYAAIFPDDLSAIKRALLGPLIGAKIEDIHLGIESKVLQRAKTFFLSENARITQKGWGAFFQNFLSFSWDEQRSVTTLESLLKRQEKNLYFELRQLMQIIMQSCPDIYAIESFYDFYTNLTLLDSDDEILKVHKESEEDQVIVMTIHTSKGLEFDIVFALGLVSRISSQNEIVITKENGADRLEKWDIKKESCMKALLESDAEKMRHLYVALTRAKRKIYIPIAIDIDKKEVELSCASAIELLCQSFGRKNFNIAHAYTDIHLLTKEDVIKHLQKISQNASIGYVVVDDKYRESIQSVVQHQDVDLFFPTLSPVVFKEQKLISFSSIHHQLQKEDIQQTTPPDDQRPLDQNILPIGSETGTILHRILEIIIKEQMLREFDHQLIQDLIQEHTQGTDLALFTSEIFVMIDRILHTPLLANDPEFILSNVPSTDFFLEMEFAFDLNGNMMKGFIDAVFIWKNKFYILDWKTNFLGSNELSYDDENIKKVMNQQDYYLQAAIYCEALKRYVNQFELADFSECFGGALYIFLRGNKVYHFIPDTGIISNF